MKAQFLDSEEKYDGSQLVSLHNYLQHKLLGDSIVAWVGPCDVSFEHMADGEDLIQQAEIRGSKMLHFLVEKFETQLFSAVALQRLMAAIIKDQIAIMATDKKMAAAMFREGDDLYIDDRKLSISIATQSPLSSLIHFAVNVSNAGTPVQTLSLEDLGIDPKILALETMTLFSNEVKSIRQATQKVRWVK